MKLLKTTYKDREIYWPLRADDSIEPSHIITQIDFATQTITIKPNIQEPKHDDHELIFLLKILIVGGLIGLVGGLVARFLY